MNVNVKTALLSALIGGLILAVVGISAWALSRAQDTAEAQGVVTTLAIDMDPKDGGASYTNDDHTVGTINPCIEVTAGATVEFDVVLDAIPADRDLSAYQYFMGFDSANLKFTAETSPGGCKVSGPDGVQMLCRVPGDATVGSCQGMIGCIDGGEGVPEPPDNGEPASPGVHDVFHIDRAVIIVGGVNDPYGTAGGVLGRYTIDTTDAAAGLYGFGLNDSATYTITVNDMATIPIWDRPGDDDDNDGDGATDEDLMLDNTASPQHGLIAIAPTTCPVVGNVDIVSQSLVDKDPDNPVSGICQVDPVVDPPTDIDVSHHEWICLEKTIHNYGSDPVDVEIYKIATVPASPTGGEVSYHCAGTESEVIVDGTPTGACDAGTVHEGGVIEVQEVVSSVLVCENQLIEEQWDVHCTNPSTHVFTFENLIVPVGVADPDLELAGCDPADLATWPSCGDNYAQSQYSVNCLAVADLEVTSAAVDAPDNAAIDTAFEVTVDANVTNNGPWASVNADVTLELDLDTGAPDCTATEALTQTVQESLGTDVVASFTWHVTCTETGLQTFNGEASVALSSGQPHIEDRNTGNNGPDAATPDSTTITAGTDVEIVSWTFPDELTGIDGNQLLVETDVPEDMVTTEVLHNQGGGTYADPVDVDITVTVTPDVNCTATPYTTYPTTANLPVCEDQAPDTHTWSVNLTSGNSCTIALEKDVLITTGGVSDTNSANNEDYPGSVDLVLDTDGDTVPDNYDATIDNCFDVANPGQEDVDGDCATGDPSNCGDVCDPDDDNDGIPDDGDDSGDPFDNPCEPGETSGCDDNCRLIPNGEDEDNQADEDLDGIGNVCELDVDCDNDLDTGDIILMLRYIAEWGDPPPALSDDCPPPAGDLNGPRATAYDDGVDTADLVAMVQCNAGLPFENIVCPAPPE